MASRVSKDSQVPTLRSETIAKILVGLCQPNLQVADASLIQLVRSLINRTKMSTPVVCAALYYASRFKNRIGCSVNVLFVLCLMLANKYWDDSTFCSGSWATVAKISPQDLSRLEIVCLKLLNYNLGLSSFEWNRWLSVIISLSQSYQQQQQQQLQLPIYNNKPPPCQCPACSLSPRPVRNLLPPASTFLCSPCSSPPNDNSIAGYTPLSASLTYAAYPSPVSTRANSSPLSQYSSIISPVRSGILPPIHPKRSFSTMYGDDDDQYPPLKRSAKIVGRHTYCCPPSGEVLLPHPPQLKPLMPALQGHIHAVSYHSSPKLYKQCRDDRYMNQHRPMMLPTAHDTKKSSSWPNIPM